MSKMLKHWENLFRKHNTDCLRKKEGKGGWNRSEEEVSTEHHHPGGKRDVLLAKDQGGPQRTDNRMTVRIPPL